MKQRKSFQNTVLLIVILLALGGAIWWLLSTQESALNKKLVVQIPEPTVESIEITKINPAGIKNEFTVQREGSSNTWKLIKPVQDEANTSIVANIAKVFEKFEVENTVQDAKNLADYGLDKPMLTVTITYQKTHHLTLSIGQEAPFPGTYYAKLADKPEILVLSSSVKTDLDNEMNRVREKKVLDIDSKNVQAVEFKNKNKPDYQLVTNNEHWTLESPFREKMVQAKVVQVINSLNAIIADDFGDSNALRDYGLDHPEFWLELSLNNGKKVVVKANQVNDNYYLTTSERQAVFRLSSSQNLDWQFDPENQLDKRLVIYAQNEVQAVKYQSQGNPEQELTGDNMSKIWTPLSLLNVTGFYYASPGASQPVTADSAKSLAPVYRYTIQRGMQNLLLTIYAAADQKGYLVTSNERQYIYKINRSDIDNLNLKIREVLKPGRE